MAKRILVPTEGEERAEFIAMLKEIRCEGVPKVRKMMQLLEHEAEHAKRDIGRVAAQRAHIRHTFEASQLLYEMELGVENELKPGRSPSVQILVAMPNGDSRTPSGQELKAILADISESVRTDAEKRPTGDEA